MLLGDYSELFYDMNEQKNKVLERLKNEWKREHSAAQQRYSVSRVIHCCCVHGSMHRG